MQHFYARCFIVLMWYCSTQAAFAQRQFPSPLTVTDHCVTEIELRVESAISAQKYTDALSLAEEFGQVARTRFGEESRCYADALKQQATALQLMDRFAQAGPLYEQALALFRKYAPPDDPKLTLTLNNLGVYYFQMRQYDQAARAHEEALELRRRRQPSDEAAVAESLHNLADAYRYLGRSPEDVLKLYEEALAIKTRVLKPGDVSIGQTLQNLASAQESLGDLNGASRNLEQALALYRRGLPPKDSRIAAVINRQAIVQFMQGAYKEAEVKFREALRLYRGAATTQRTALAAILDDFSFNEIRLAHLKEAKRLANESLQIRRAIFPENHPTIARTLSNLSYVALLDGDYGEALSLAREASDITIASGKLDDASRLRFQRHLLAAWSEGARDSHAPSPELASEAFVIGQRAIRTDTAVTLSRTALRLSASNVGLRQLLRDVDDVDRELVGLEQSLTHSLTLASDQSAKEFRDIRAKMAANFDRRSHLIDAIEKSFPDYANLVDPKPLSASTAQSLLQPDEALVMVAEGYEEETLIWVVTKSEVRWVRSELGTPSLTREVSALRCGLDYQGSWTDSHCADLLKVAYTHADHDVFGRPLPFDLARAHELYKGLFGQIEDLIEGKRLLIVLSGPLTQLPFQVLVTESPKTALPSSVAGYRDSAWLVRKHAITVLPAVSSLKALRELAKESHASEAYVGFGNPLLDGDPARFRDDAMAAKLARDARCPQSQGQVASLLDRGAARMSVRSNGGLADVADVRTWAPLPETADELCDVAQNLGVDPATHLYIGSKATETEIKQLSDAGTLAKYKVVHFATHGAVAGELSGANEPGLILTPPDKASEADDGYLSASEIAGLKLDADWVILSACNTAAGDAKGAEALSGLARAFFYAGARSLLVSHWEVSSDSTVKLITKAIADLKTDPKIGRADALRRSILDLIDKGKTYEAHPAFWAPFVLVGEGGASR
jgi:CHAT domain-containing protein/tetratricopeptide (TPR) repeat protein